MDRFGETFREAVRAIEVMRERGREEIEQLKRELDGALRREGEARERGDRLLADTKKAEARADEMSERLAAAEQAANLNLAALAAGGPLRLILRDSLGGKESAADVWKAGDDDTPVLIVEEVDGEEIEWLRRLVRAYNVLRGHDEDGDAKLDAAPREAAERCSARAAERAAGRIARILRADGGESFRPMIASVIVDEIHRMYEPDEAPTEEQAAAAAGLVALDATAPLTPLTDTQKAIIREIAMCGALHPATPEPAAGCSPLRCTLGNGHEGPHVAEGPDLEPIAAWGRREMAP